jgi:predicted HTH transcriptional regulator
MKHTISKKNINELRLKISDSLDFFYSKHEGEFFEMKLLEELKKNLIHTVESIRDVSNNDSNILSDRQFKMLKYLGEFNEISRREYASMFDVSFMTAFRDLEKLVEKGVIVSIGRGRGTKYILK